MSKNLKFCEEPPEGVLVVESTGMRSVVAPILEALHEGHLLEPAFKSMRMPWVIRKTPLEDLLGQAPVSEVLEGLACLSDVDACRFVGAVLKAVLESGDLPFKGVGVFCRKETYGEMVSEVRTEYHDSFRGALRACWWAGVCVYACGPTWLEEAISTDDRFSPFCE